MGVIQNNHSPSGKKYALIVNADTEPKHLGNVKNAIQALEAEADYEIAVLSPNRPANGVDLYAPPTEKGLEKIIAKLKGKMGKNDQLVVYFSGHGGIDEVSGEECTQLEKNCIPTSDIAESLNELNYSQRAVILDACLSGASLTYFIDGKTSLVSLGSPGEIVFCQEFSPYFWSTKVTDYNGDGVLSLRERYQFAKEKGQPRSSTQFYPELAFSFSGKIPQNEFPAKNGSFLRETHTVEGLEGIRKSLKPGQYLRVMFSADWCKFCKKSLPVFEGLANEEKGRFLNVYAESIGDSGKWKEKYNISMLPTFAYMDHEGRLTIVHQGLLEEGEAAEKLLKPLEKVLLNDVSEVQKYYREKLDQASPEQLPEVFKSLGGLGENASSFVPELIQATYHQDEEISKAASDALIMLLANSNSSDFSDFIYEKIWDEYKNASSELPNALMNIFSSLGWRTPFAHYLESKGFDENSNTNDIIRLIFYGNEYSLKAWSVTHGKIYRNGGKFIVIGQNPLRNKDYQLIYDARWDKANIAERLAMLPYYEAIRVKKDPLEKKSSEAINSYLDDLNLEGLIALLDKASKRNYLLKSDLSPEYPLYTYPSRRALSEKLKEYIILSLDRRWKKATLSERMAMLPYYEAVELEKDPVEGLPLESINSYFDAFTFEELLELLKKTPEQSNLSKKLKEYIKGKMDEKWKAASLAERFDLQHHYITIFDDFEHSAEDGIAPEQFFAELENLDVRDIHECILHFFSHDTKLAVKFKKQIVTLLNHESSKVKIWALEIIADMGIRAKSERKAVEELLKDPDPLVQAEALLTLDHMEIPGFDAKEKIEKIIAEHQDNEDLLRDLEGTYDRLTGDRIFNNIHWNLSLGMSSQQDRLGPKLEAGLSYRRRHLEFGLGFQSAHYKDLSNPSEDFNHYIGGVASSSVHILRYQQIIDPQIIPLQVGVGRFIGQKNPWMVLNLPGLALDFLLNENSSFLKIDLGIGVKPRMATDFKSKPEWGVDAEVGISVHF